MRKSSLLAAAAAAIVTLSACGGERASNPSEPPTTTEPGPVNEEGLAAARSVVIGFVEALGAGDVERAALLVGPISERNADEAGGLEAMLRASTEGHGAWAAATDRAVTAIGIDAGLVAVMLEGTLQVEGTTEHRVEVFPVRKTESAGAWFVEPWAYDLDGDPPIEILAPPVDEEELANADPAEPLEVRVQVAEAGRVYVSFDAGSPSSTAVAEDEATAFTPEATGVTSVVIVYASGPELAATGFRVQGPGG